MTLRELRGFGLRILAAALAVPAGSWAQCAMCATAAAAQKAEAARALNIGILMLFLPAVSVFCGVFVFALRRGNDEAFRESGIEERQCGSKT